MPISTFEEFKKKNTTPVVVTRSRPQRTFSGHGLPTVDGERRRPGRKKPVPNSDSLNGSFSLLGLEAVENDTDIPVVVKKKPPKTFSNGSTRSFGSLSNGSFSFGMSNNNRSFSSSSVGHRSFSGGLARLPPKRDRKCGRGGLEASLSRGLALSDDTQGEATTSPFMRSLRFSTQDFVQQHHNSALEDHYQLGELLGEGAFGSVYLGECKEQPGVQRAIKIISKAEMLECEYEEVVNEFHILKSLDHPNILKMYKFFQDTDTFCIVTDISRGGELYDELAEQGTFSESDVALLMKQVLSCCKYLQEHNIVHCDINLENCLLESNKELDQIKVIDFGLAAKLGDSDQRLFEVKGKAHYVAPEVLGEDGYNTKYDIWSAGVMAHICLVGFAPFDADDDGDIYTQILEGTLPSLEEEEWNDVSASAKDFVRQLLTHSPEARPNASEALQHPFMVQHRAEQHAHFKRRSSTLAQTALGNLRRRASSMVNNKLQEVAYSYIASQLLGQAEKEQVDKVFRAMDQDCDGKLSKSEIQNGYNEYFGTQLNSEELDSLFHRIDLSGSGSIDYSEFVIATMESSNLLGGNRLKAAFDNFDRDNQGFISHDNLRDALSAVVQDAQAIEKIFMQVDTNGDGEITYDEFKSLMMVPTDATTTAAASEVEPTKETDVPNPESEDQPKRKSFFDSDSDSEEEDLTDSETEDDTT